MKFSFFTEIKKNRYLYLLALPGILFLIIFAYIPLSAHLLAFKDFKLSTGIWGSKWVGFKNFGFFFGSPDWLHVTFNTIFLNSLFIFFGLGFALIIAVLLNEINIHLFKKTMQSIIFLPYFISWLVISIMVYILLNSTNGLANRFLISIGLNSIEWYQRSELWPIILTVIYIWRMSGYHSIIFLAAITGISQEMYESAKIDGTSKFQQIIYITIPQLRPLFMVLVLLGIGRIFYGDFGMIYGIVGDNGILYPTTDVIDTYSYRALRQLGNFSMSSAVVLYQSVMGLCAICFFNWIAKKIDKDYSLF